MSSSKKRIAAIDLGTNTIILLIGERSSKTDFQILHDEARVVRLGEGIHQNSFFLDEAMNRAYQTLNEFKKIIDDKACDEVRAVGTAGFRNAKNAQIFIDRVKEGLGISIDVISGDKEAELIYRSVKHDFSFLEQPFLVLDIGGGSTEFIFEQKKSETKLFAKSLPFGSVKLTERFLPSDPPTKQELLHLDTFLQQELNQFEKIQSQKIVATAGTATTLAALSFQLEHYDSNCVHGCEISLQDLQSLLQKLETMTCLQRSVLPCLEPKRADVIVAGGHILIQVCQYFQISQVLVSDRGLRYGLLY